MAYFEVHDPAFAPYVIGNAPLKRLATGFDWAEGPVWFGDHGCLLFSDIPSNRILRWSEEGLTTFRAPANHANGHTRDRQGRLVSCEHGTRRVTRTEWDGAITVLAEGWQGKKLNSPNDVVIHSSGAIFFTDPTYGIDTGRVPAFGSPGQTAELDFQGVYRIDPDGTVELVVSTGFTQPNGLAFSPQEATLYIGDSQERLIWAYDVAPNLSLWNRSLFVDQKDDPRRGAPDGMKVDSEGRLWTTGAGGVSVHSASGEYLGVFELDEHAANLTFGGENFSTLFMTAGTSVYAIETTVRGLVPGSR